MKYLASLLLITVLTACGHGAGDSYLGKWQNVKRPKETLEIVKNGDTYLIKRTAVSFFSKGQLETSNIPAVLKDEILQINAGMGPVNIGYLKDSDQLTMPSMGGGSIEYKRLK